MNIVYVTAPIAIDDLKKYFVDKTTFFNIDYSASSLKGVKVLTYLSNLDIPADLNLEGSDKEQVYELVQAYMNSQFIVNIKSLEDIVIAIMLEYKGITNDNQYSEFIEQNEELIKSWVNKVDSLTLYNMYSIEEERFKTFVKSFPKDDTNSLEGVNFISLIKNENMYNLYAKIDKSNLKFYEKYFNDYMFKGKNLYSYWANPNNPLFLLTFNIADGSITGDGYVETIKKDEEFTDVSPV